MRRTTKKNLILEEYSSTTEFLRVVENRPDNHRADWYSDTVRAYDNSSWSGDTLKNARKKLVYGDPKAFKELKGTAKTKGKTETQSRPKYFNSPVGYTPNVPNAVMGLPDSMISMRMDREKTKILNVLVDVGASSNVSSKAIAKFWNEALNYIQGLERRGYRVRLSVLGAFCEDSGIAHLCTLPIKSEGQPLDMKRVAYPMIASSMLRELFFDWYETLPGAKHLSGYGRPLYLLSNSGREGILSQIGEHGIYLNYNCDLKERFGV